MKLNIFKYITNIITREMKISHIDFALAVGKTSKLSKKIKAKISDSSRSFLTDSSFVVIFSGLDGKGVSFKSEDKKRIFNMTNRALGKDANDMTIDSFITISMANNSNEINELFILPIVVD